MSGGIAGSGRCPADGQLDFELGAQYAARRMDIPPETYFFCKATFIGVPLLLAALPVGRHRLRPALYRCHIRDEGTLPGETLLPFPKCLRYDVIRMTVANQQRGNSRSRSTPGNSRLFLEAPARRVGKSLLDATFSKSGLARHGDCGRQPALLARGNCHITARQPECRGGHGKGGRWAHGCYQARRCGESVDAQSWNCSLPAMTKRNGLT
jgi:hypothetical protein